MLNYHFTFRQMFRVEEPYHYTIIPTSVSRKRDLHRQDFIITLMQNFLAYIKSKAFSKSMTWCCHRINQLYWSPYKPTKNSLFSICMRRELDSISKYCFGDKHCSLYEVSLINIYSFCVFIGSGKMRNYKVMSKAKNSWFKPTAFRCISFHNQQQNVVASLSLVTLICV